MFISPTQRLRLYRDFKSIDPRDPFSIIRYYEQHEEVLNTLDMDEFMDCALAYINALFEAEEHARHIVMCDFMIEFVMRENVTYFAGEDVFCTLLYKKGLSWYRLNEYKNAARVLQSVIKIAPENQQARLILMNCLLQEMPKRRLSIRAWGILILLLSAITAGVSGLAIQPFYPDWLPLATYAAGSLFVTGGAVYVWAEVEHYFRCKKAVNTLC